MASKNLLKDIQIKNAKPKEKNYSLNDGGGLRLKVKIDGSKIWEFRYTFNGKRRETTFKSYVVTSLQNARMKRDNYLDLLAKGIDPISKNKKEKQEQIIDIKGIFLNVASEWLQREKERLSESTYEGKLKVFKKDVYPLLKNKHMKEIQINDIVEVIELKQLQAREVASKIFNYLDNLFRYAVLKGYCKRNLLADIRKSDIIKPKRVRHYPKITDEKILKELIETIYTYKGDFFIRNALKLVLHIPLRAENLCTIKWDYLNFEEKSLTIPRSEMKVKNDNLNDFKIPLSDEVINIFNEVKPFSEHQDYVFLGRNNKSHINKESPNKALKIMGFNDEEKGRKIRLHGFRGTFRSMVDTLDIKPKFSFELKERILDHHETNETVRAYNHKADYFEQMKPLVKWWSEYLESLRG